MDTPEIECTETKHPVSAINKYKALSVDDIIVEEGEAITCVFRSQQLAPTSAPASISGRVTDSNGYGIRNVRISVQNMITGEIRHSYSNPFGYYSFASLPTSHMYTVSAKTSRRYSFAVSSYTFNLYDNMTGIDFQLR